MITYQLRWRSSLYWEIVKLNAFTCAEKLLSTIQKLGLHSDDSQDVARARNPNLKFHYSKKDVKDFAVILGRQTKSGRFYETIRPFMGKGLLDKQTFEQTYTPLEPKKVRRSQETNSSIEKSVYQKYFPVVSGDVNRH